jgi:hypothetical protein
VRRVVTHTGVTDTPTRAPKLVPDVSDTPDGSYRSHYSAGTYRRPILFSTFPTLPTFGVGQGARNVDRRPTHLSKFRRTFWTIWRGENLVDSWVLGPALTSFANLNARARFFLILNS